MIHLSKRDSEESMYDSSKDTQEHIDNVAKFMNEIAKELTERGKNHDKSKLEDFEKPYFDESTPKLKNLEYGTKEYKESLDHIKPALDHHYKENRHHPEYFKNGVDDMDLIDLTEMICDWIAASKRMKDGDPIKALETSAKRFKLSDQLKSIVLNTIKKLQRD